MPIKSGSHEDAVKHHALSQYSLIVSCSLSLSSCHKFCTVSIERCAARGVSLVFGFTLC